MTANDTLDAGLWLTAGLARWPHEPGLLNLAGKLAASKGNYLKAQSYWRSALVALQQKERLAASEDIAGQRKKAVFSADADGDDPVQDLGRLLLAVAGPVPKKEEKPRDGLRMTVTGRQLRAESRSRATETALQRW